MLLLLILVGEKEKRLAGWRKGMPLKLYCSLQIIYAEHVGIIVELYLILHIKTWTLSQCMYILHTKPSRTIRFCNLNRTR